MGLADWDIFYDARRLSGNNLADLGSAGAGVATAAGNARSYSGPNIWFPGTTGNTLTQGATTVTPSAGVLTLPYTVGSASITADDIPTDEAATSFDTRDGHTITVGRSTTAGAQATRIIPANRSAVVIPDPSGTTDKLTIGDLTGTVSALNGEPITMLCAFTLGNAPSAAGKYLARVGLGTSTLGVFPSTSGALSGLIRDSSSALVSTTAPPTPAKNELHVATVQADSGWNTLTLRVFDSSGAEIANSPRTASISTLSGDWTPTTSEIGEEIPGSVEFLALDTGTAYTDDEIEALVSSLLATYTGPPTRSRPLTTTRTNRKLTLV